MLYLISGPSGCGKTTIMRRLMSNEIVSFTTRAPRAGEIDGVDYHFITLAEFWTLRGSNTLIEYTEYGGNYYGVERGEVERKLAHGDAFFICDRNGMEQMQRVIEPTTSIFVWCYEKEARLHMRQRGDSFEHINKRMATFEQEIENSAGYNYMVQNHHGFLEEAVNDMRCLLERSKSDVSLPSR